MVLVHNMIIYHKTFFSLGADNLTFTNLTVPQSKVKLGMLKKSQMGSGLICIDRWRFLVTTPRRVQQPTSAEASSSGLLFPEQKRDCLKKVR